MGIRETERCKGGEPGTSRRCSVNRREGDTCREHDRELTPRVRKGQPSCPWEVLLSSRGRGKPSKSLKQQKKPRPLPALGWSALSWRSPSSEGCCEVQAASSCLSANSSPALPAKPLILLTLPCSSGGNSLPSCLLLGSSIARGSQSLSAPPRPKTENLVHLMTLSSPAGLPAPPRSRAWCLGLPSSFWTSHPRLLILQQEHVTILY